MKTVRKSIFETNSSSMHSITIQDVKDKSHDHFENSELVTIELGVYQRYPQMLLYTPEKKLSYIISYLLDYIFDDEKIEKKVKSALSALEKFFNDEDNDLVLVPYTDNRVLFRKIYTAVKSHTKAKFRFVLAENCNYYYAEGYGEIKKYLETHDIGEVIFNPDYIIVVDGDEYCRYLDNSFGDPKYTNALSLLIDPAEIWAERKYNFGDELILNNTSNELTLNKFHKVISLGSKNFNYGLRQNFFNGIIYKKQKIKSKKGCIFYYDYDSLVYGVPHLFSFTNKLECEIVYDQFQRNDTLRRLIISGKDGDQIYSLKNCRVKITEDKNGFYIEFYENENS